MATANIKEIFESIQGEALYIGQKQIFIRFCGCNLNCAYCDTDFQVSKEFPIYNLDKAVANPINPTQLAEIIKNFSAQTISLTGGEPLLHTDFLLEFLPLVKDKKIYLETNGTLPDELQKVINLVDIISMDIKLSCSTAQENQFEKNKKFIEISKNANKENFAKIVLDKNYDKKELLNATKSINEYNIPLIIQPMDCKVKANELDKKSILELFEFASKSCPDVRFIPQTHKYFGLL